ncbi:hypothetical protein LCGC14_3044050, partial [marine sediment metagenome]
MVRSTLFLALLMPSGGREGKDFQEAT